MAIVYVVIPIEIGRGSDVHVTDEVRVLHPGDEVGHQVVDASVKPDVNDSPMQRTAESEYGSLLWVEKLPYHLPDDFGKKWTAPAIHHCKEMQRLGASRRQQNHAAFWTLLLGLPSSLPKLISIPAASFLAFKLLPLLYTGFVYHVLPTIREVLRIIVPLVVLAVLVTNLAAIATAIDGTLAPTVLSPIAAVTLSKFLAALYPLGPFGQHCIDLVSLGVASLALAHWINRGIRNVPDTLPFSAIRTTLTFGDTSFLRSLIQQS